MSYLVVLLALCGAVYCQEFVQTPHGLRLKQCVHIAEEYEVIIEDFEGQGVSAYYPKSGRRVFHPLLPECIANKSNIISDYIESSPNLGAWMDFADDANTPQMGIFTSDYTLPNENPPQAKQLLYYFIGLVNYNNAETIIQPVVQYDYSGQYPAGWSMESWNCCPSGQSWQSKTIDLPENAVNIPTLCSSNSSSIYVTMEYNGQSTSLLQSNIARDFNWICATLESYSVPNCNDYNDKPFNFTNMKVTTLNGENYTPKWSLTGDAKCKGGAVVYQNDLIGVYGTNKP